ncbi:MAG TPA: hypothetical protein VGK26_09565 [Thermoanaerobaculia bacterium]
MPALCPSVARAGANRWTVDGPPDSVNSVKVDLGEPGTVYAGGGGVWKRSGDGSEWESVGPEPYLARVAAVAPPGHVYATDTTVLANAFANVLWESANGGAAWTLLRAGDDQTSYSVAVDPFDPGIVYLVTEHSEGLVTTSGLERIGGSGTWTSPIDGQPVTFYDVVPDPRTEGTLFVTSNLGIFKTTDAGATWDSLNDSMRAVRTLVVDPSAPSILYAAVSAPPGEGGVYKSVDGGATFGRSNAGLVVADNAGPLVADAQHPGRLFVSTRGGVYQSDDFGASWRGIDEGLLDYFVFDLAIDPSGAHLYAATEIGAFEYTIAPRESVLLPQTETRKPVTVRERP